MRTTFSKVSLVLVAAVLTAGSGVAQTPPTVRTLSVATLAPQGSTYMRVLDSANRELRQRSNGALQLRFYAGGVQGDESEVVRKMRAGRIDMGVFTGVGLGQIHRPVLAFMLPGMFDSGAGFTRAHRSLAAEIEGQFLTNGFVMLSWGETGTPRMFSQRPIRTPEDLRQTRPWVWRDDLILPALYAEARANPVPLQVPEVLAALQTNRIDTVVAPPLAAVALQWNTRLTHVSGQTASHGLGGIVISRRAYDGLPEDQRTLLRTVITQFNGLMARNVARDDAAALRNMQSRGMTLVEVGPAERGQWLQLFERTRRRLVGQIADQAFMDRIRNAGR